MTYPPPPGTPDPYGQQPVSPPPTPSSPFTPPPAAPPNPYDPYAQQQQQQPASPYSAPPQYGQPYGAVPQYPYGPQMADPNKNNGLAIGAMSTGIASILAACCCPVLGLMAGVAGLIMGFISRKQIMERGGQGNGMALTAIITGGVGVLVAIANIILGATMNQNVWQDILNNSNNFMY